VKGTRDLPESIGATHERATAAGFRLTCELEVGRLLAVLSEAVPSGRILEIGTGVGGGLAWLIHGLGERLDVGVEPVELVHDIQQAACSAEWPPWVRFESRDGAEVVSGLGQFDLIFPDAPGGKIFKLSRVVAALRPGGFLAIDDMEATRHEDERLRTALIIAQQRLVGNPELICTELDFASGVIVAVKRRV